MQVAVIGTSYVGLVAGACLADLGNRVLCVDLDPAKIAMLQRGELPIYEPGLKELVEDNVAAGRLAFTTDVAAGVEFANIQFIAVGTPIASGHADLTQVLEAARNIGRHMTEFKVIVDKSTVPVGTGEQLAGILCEEIGQRNASIPFAVVSNPEFLKEGSAIADFMRPDRIVLGVDDSPEGARALAMLRQLYAPFNRHHERTQVMDIRSAEFTKYAANAMLATRISFMNELANLADQLGADIESVRQGIGADPRIGCGFLYAGTGYGGSCLRKDVLALAQTARDHGQRLRVLEVVEAVNEEQKCVIARKIFERYGSRLEGRTFAVWGLAFKPDTDDMREAPSRGLICALLRAGATIQAHDPVAKKRARAALAEDLRESPALLAQVEFVSQPMDAVRNVDALIVVTEWKAYRSPNFRLIKQSMREPLIFDGRNLYEPQAMQEAGFTCIGIGRGTRHVAAAKQKSAR